MRKDISGKNNPCYRHGKTYNNRCIDCNKKIDYASTRCPSCAKKGKLNVNYKHGKKYCKECNIVINYVSTYCNNCKAKGSRNGNYKNGKSGLIASIRRTEEYKKWRDQIYNRDNYTCQYCHVRGGNLHAHHKQKLTELVVLNKINTIEEAKQCQDLWDINNGITLCEHHHNLIERVK